MPPRKKFRPTLPLVFGGAAAAVTEEEAEAAAAAANPEMLSIILPGLLIGSNTTPAYVLDRYSVTHVLSTAAEESESPYGDRYSYARFGFNEGETVGAAALLEDAVGYIKSALTAGCVVLVTCAEGKNRSPTAVIAYLVSEGMLLEEARALVVARRPVASPSFLSELYLRNYATKRLMAEIARIVETETGPI